MAVERGPRVPIDRRDAGGKSIMRPRGDDAPSSRSQVRPAVEARAASARDQDFEARAVSAREQSADRVEEDLTLLVLRGVSDAIVALDGDACYTFVNEQAARIFQRRPAELLGKQLWALFPDAVGDPFYQAYQRAIETQEFTVVENYYPPWDRWIESRMYPSAQGISIFFHDVSERRRAETLLIGQAEVLQQIAQGATLSTVLNALLKYLDAHCGGARCTILLLDADGAHLRHGAAPSMPESFTQAIDGSEIGPMAGSCGTAAFSGQSVITEDIDNDPRWVEWKRLALPLGLRACWSTPIFDQRGTVLGTFAIYYEEVMAPRQRDQAVVEMATHIASIAITADLARTQRREQERVRDKNRELEESNRAIQEASRLKSEFLANMSHELRTPLNAIIGFSEFLSDGTAGPITEKQHECLSHVLTSGRHLLRLISDVLDLAKVESGKLDLFPVDFCLREELDEVCSVARALAQEKEIDVSLECDAAPERVTLDAQKLKQVLFNLLANAVKFTDDGGSIRVTARALEGDCLEICVRDSGIGIRQQDLSQLFQEFRQLDTPAGRRHEGTGLGLVLTKRLVESQHGRISVESELGRGSVFRVVLPRVLRDGPAR
jgi:signal transduction histidine kinase/PAS domain-containing protein